MGSLRKRKAEDWGKMAGKALASMISGGEVTEEELSGMASKEANHLWERYVDLSQAQEEVSPDDLQEWENVFVPEFISGFKCAGGSIKEPDPVYRDIGELWQAIRIKAINAYDLRVTWETSLETDRYDVVVFRPGGTPRIILRRDAALCAISLIETFMSIKES